VKSPLRQRGLFDVAEDPGSAAEGARASDNKHSASASHPIPDLRPCQATLAKTAAAIGYCPVCDGPAQREANGKLWWCAACVIAFDRPVRVQRKGGRS
jgi:hypothetical protein